MLRIRVKKVTQHLQILEGGDEEKRHCDTFNCQPAEKREMSVLVPKMAYHTKPMQLVPRSKTHSIIRGHHPHRKTCRAMILRRSLAQFQCWPARRCPLVPHQTMSTKKHTTYRYVYTHTRVTKYFELCSEISRELFFLRPMDRKKTSLMGALCWVVVCVRCAAVYWFWVRKCHVEFKIWQCFPGEAYSSSHPLNSIWCCATGVRQSGAPVRCR